MGYDLDQLTLARLLLQRGVAAIYLVAFASAYNQFPALLGEHGLLPVRRYLRRITFRGHPSLFHWRYSDRLLRAVAVAGMVLAAAALLGLTERLPIALSVAAGLVLWFLYLSIVNVGQTFYAFGWESMLVEAGFLAAFLGPAATAASPIPVLALRWMLFRVELGAGLIKLRHDSCWRDLTCLDYHHETQPLPNPLSARFHRLPRIARRGGVVFSHLVQVVVPFALLAPQPLAGIAGVLIVAHQLLLIVAGNYAWLNWLTVVLAASAFSDRFLHPLLPLAAATGAPRPLAYDVVLGLLATAVAGLSIAPVRNLFSRRQLMNYSYNPLHLVNTYGAFGSVTRERYEVIVEGTADDDPGPRTEWREYGFRAKPGDLRRRPPQVAPYHLRLDWLMWFLPFSVRLYRPHRGDGPGQVPGQVLVPGYETWFLAFVERLLEGDRATLGLLRRGANPFPEAPPRFVRASYYLYHFATPEERRATGAWWTRTLVGEYLPPVELADLQRADGLAAAAT